MGKKTREVLLLKTRALIILRMGENSSCVNGFARVCSSCVNGQAPFLERRDAVPDFRFLRDLCRKHRHAAGWRDEQRVFGMGEQERREHSQKGQCPAVTPCNGFVLMTRG